MLRKKGKMMRSKIVTEAQKAVSTGAQAWLAGSLILVVLFGLHESGWALSRSAAGKAATWIEEGRLGPELFPEGSFENGIPTAEVPRDWDRELEYPIAVGLDREVKHSGNFSLRVKKAKTRDYGATEANVGWVNLQMPALETGKLYRIALWLKTDGKGVKASVVWPMQTDIYYTYFRAWMDPHPRYPDPGGTIGTEWLYLQKDARAAAVKPGSPAGKLRLFIGGIQGGEAWFDDISIREVKEDQTTRSGSVVLEDFERGKMDALAPANEHCPYPDFGPTAEVVKGGKYAFRVAYEFKNEKSRLVFSPLDAASGYEKGNWAPPGKVTMWIYGDGRGIKVTPTHGFRDSPPPVAVDWKGWKKVEFDCSKLQWNGFSWGLLLSNPDGQERKGTVCIDDIAVEESAALAPARYFTTRIVDGNALSLYKPKEEVHLSLRVRNNTKEEQKAVRVRYMVEDFWGQRVKEGEKRDLRLAPETEVEVFAVAFVPKMKGLYYTSLEVESGGMEYWEDQPFGVLEPNPPMPLAEAGGMYINGVELDGGAGLPRDIPLGKMLGLNSWTRNFISAPPEANDQYRWDYWDKRSKRLQEAGMTMWTAYSHQLQWVLKHEGDPGVMERAKHIKYWTLGGEENYAPDPEYVKDPKEKEKLDKYIKTHPSELKKQVEEARRLFPDAKVSPFWCFMWDCTDKDGTYLIDWLKELKGYADFFTYITTNPRENVRYNDRVRRMYFEKAGVNLPCGLMAIRGAIETAVPLAYSWGFQYVSFEAAGLAGSYPASIETESNIARGHLTDVYGYPNYPYVFLNTIIKMLSGAERKGAFDISESVHVCKYKKDGKFIYYLYSEWPIGETVKLPFKVKEIQGKDIMDNAQTFKLKDGAMHVPYWPIQLITEEEIIK